METVQRRGWFRIGSNPTVEVTGSRDNVTVLGAVTHGGDTFHCWTEENLTADHGALFLRALKEEFGDDLVILLDQAPYFYAEDVWELVSEEGETGWVDETSVECVVGEELRLWYFPSHAPELNPVEAWWNELEEWFNFRFIENLEQLQQLLKQGLDEVSPPDVRNYMDF